MPLPAIKNNFQLYTQVEQLRGMESLPEKIDRSSLTRLPLAAGSESRATSFEQWLLHRLQCFKQTPEAKELLSAGPSSFYLFRWVLLFAGILIGFLSASGLLSADQQQVNIFWLLGAILGTNAITLILWLLFVLLGGRHQGALAGVLEWLLQRIYTLPQKQSVQGASRRYWWQVQLSRPQQSWQIAVLVHGTWLSLLLGSLLGLLLVFTTQRYDFVWESTLIDENSFARIFSALYQPLSALGWPTPINENPLLDPQQQRRSWAWFVIGCLLIYALLPRLLAFGIAQLYLLRARRKWRPDYSISYYANLQHQFDLVRQSFKIIDADQDSQNHPLNKLHFSQQKPPYDAPWFGLEVNPQAHWQTCFFQFSGLLNSHQSIDSFQPPPGDYVIFVEAKRTPDRGLKRHLKRLHSRNTWLAVVSINHDKNKLSAWLNAAEETSFDLQKCVLIDLSSQQSVEVQS